jgi:hypothetical protein
MTSEAPPVTRGLKRPNTSRSPVPSQLPMARYTPGQSTPSLAPQSLLSRVAALGEQLALLLPVGWASTQSHFQEFPHDGSYVMSEMLRVLAQAVVGWGDLSREEQGFLLKDYQWVSSLWEQAINHYWLPRVEFEVLSNQWNYLRPLYADKQREFDEEYKSPPVAHMPPPPVVPLVMGVPQSVESPLFTHLWRARHMQSDLERATDPYIHQRIQNLWTRELFTLAGEVQQAAESGQTTGVPLEAFQLLWSTPWQQVPGQVQGVLMARVQGLAPYFTGQRQARAGGGATSYKRKGGGAQQEDEDLARAMARLRYEQAEAMYY